MSLPDLNLLQTLDVLLSEGSVTAAARRLKLSQSAMSRALARLRETTGDPLLVRAGRQLVPTPRAIALQEVVRQTVAQAEAILRPAEVLDLANLKRTFTLRCSDGFAETYAPRLLTLLAASAPGLRLRFMPKLDKESRLLREGTVDMETGVVGDDTSPEIRTRVLYHDRFVGVVRPGHPLSRGKPTIARYAAGQHVVVMRRHLSRNNLVDEALAASGHSRAVALIVGGFGTAVALARSCNLIATVPERHTAGLREDLHSFALPFAVPEITVSLLWHPRHDADPAHRWLREQLRAVCSD